MNILVILKVLICFVNVWTTVFSDRVYSKIYYDFSAYSIRHCFRRLNATHQIGCSSAQGGNVGVLHYIPSEEELQWLISDGPHQPYIVLLTPYTFNRNVIDKLKQSGKVNGILMIRDTVHHPSYFSPDSSCPNANFELYTNDSRYENCKTTKWNPEGNDLLLTDVGLPIIALLSQSDISFLINECYEKFNKPLNGTIPRSYPLCGAQIYAGMDAVKDTPTCMNRNKLRNLSNQKFCDPLGDRNLFAFVHPLNTADYNHTLQNRSLIMATAKLDAAALFDGIIPGAHTSVAGFIALLAAAQALGKVKDTIDPISDKPIMFAFFQGESFDYMGSTRMMYDMEHGRFPCDYYHGIPPIYPHHIGYFLEVNQVAAPYKTSLYAHSDPRSNQIEIIGTGVSEMKALLAQFGQQVNMNITSTAHGSPLPPASLQSFLRKVNISGVVLTDFDKKFENPFYNSHLDIPSTINYTLMVNSSQTEVTPLAEHLTNVATVIANTLYNLSTGHQYKGVLEADNSTVAQMLYCFFLTPRCDLFKLTLDEQIASKLPEAPYNFYVGVNRTSSPITGHATLLLAYFLGDTVNRSAENCTRYDKDKNRDPYYNYFWMQGPVNASAPGERNGICVRTTADTLSAVSPAFIDGNDLSGTEYPAWSESIWSDQVPGLRIFLLPDRTYEIMTLCIGVAILVISLPVVFFINRQAKTIFFTAE